MKILVTGGAGFIGSHVVDALLAEGHEVQVVDNLTTGRRENLHAQALFHQMDIRSARIQELFRAERFEALVHLAAQMDVRHSVENPRLDADVNLLGFLNLMEAGRSSGLQRVVFASTGGAVYGEPEYAPQDENHPLLPASPYGVSKLASEKYLGVYRSLYGIESAVLRYANVYGPRQDPHGEAGVVAIFAQAMLEGRRPVVFGDGKQTRDYLYIDDAVRAAASAVGAGGSFTVNVGTGLETNVIRLFEMIRRLTGATCPLERRPARSGEQRRSVLTCRKAGELLGWKPEVGLEEGLARTAEWFRKSRVASG